MHACFNATNNYLGSKKKCITFQQQWQRLQMWIRILTMGFNRRSSICPLFSWAQRRGVLTSCCKTNMLALRVMVRRASFSSTAVMSASPCAGSRRAQQLNKPLGDPGSGEEMILPPDKIWQLHTQTHMHTHTVHTHLLGKVKQVGLKMHIQKASDTVYTPTQRLMFLVAWADFFM